MFLFTTPQAPAAPPEAANPVINAIRNGADKTGTGFDFLLKTAQRESALDPNAKARTSSATGLFQFIEQTWLSTLKSSGGKHGLQAYSDAIQTDSAGRLTVSDPAVKDQILALRKDPKIAAVMAGEFTQKNRDQLTSLLGRAPNAGDLYAAHVLGARGAVELIRAATTTPTREVAQDFPDAAAANRGLFYDKSGQARSAQDVYAAIAASHAGAQAGGPVAAGNGAGDAPPVQIAAALAPDRAKGLIGLFSTEGGRGPVSENVARHWLSGRTPAARQTIAEAGQRFFPRVGNAQAETPVPAAEPAATFQQATLVENAPLPPQRPAEWPRPAVAEAVAPVHASASLFDGFSLKPIVRRAPLDLKSFLNPKVGT